MKKLIFALVATLFISFSQAQVTITRPSLAINSCVYPSNYSTLGSITITEGSDSDFSNATSRTIIIDAPSYIQFQPGVGNINHQNGRNISSSSIVVTANQIIVTFSCNGITKRDELTISNLSLRTTSNGNLSLTRTAGTAEINGLINGTTLTSAISSISSELVYRSKSNLTGPLNWNNPNTWTCGIVPPNDGSAEVIISAVSGIFSQNNAVFFQNATIKSLTIETGANFSPPNNDGSTLTINGNLTIQTGAFLRQLNWVQNGKNTIEIKGDFLNNGEMTTNDNNNAYDLDIIFNGTSPQTISGSGIFRMIGKGNQTSTLFLNNPKGVSLEASFSTQDVFNDPGAVVINGLVTFGSSTNQFTGGGSLTFDGQTVLKAATFYGHYAMTGTRTFGTATTVEYTNLASNISSTNIPTLNLYRLTSNVGNNGLLTLANNVSVSNNLTLTSGKIATGINTLTVGTSLSSTGSINYSSGIIQGKLKRWFNSTNSGNTTGLFPLGINASGSNRKRFVSVEYTQATDGGTLTAEWISSSMGSDFINNPVSTSCNGNFEIYSTASGYWSMTPGDGITNAENKTYNITLQAEGILDFSDDCHITALKRQGTNPWTQSGTHVDNVGDAISPNIQRVGATGWSNWGIGGGSGTPLPVELSSFTLSCSDKGIDINWTTDSEFNSSSFELEQSTNGNDWTFISSLEAAGNSTERLNYSYFIERSDKINYIRLRQLDVNGEEKIYGPLAVNCKASFEVTTYPNPSDDNFNLIIHSVEDNKAGTMQLIDLNGRVLLEKNLSLNKGINLFQIDNVSNLVKGTYIISVSGDSLETTQIKHIIK
jgi:hypothetical protein